MPLADMRLSEVCQAKPCLWQAQPSRIWLSADRLDQPPDQALVLHHHPALDAGHKLPAKVLPRETSPGLHLACHAADCVLAADTALLCYATMACHAA